MLFEISYTFLDDTHHIMYIDINIMQYIQDHILTIIINDEKKRSRFC